jgi:hypothetical protein
MNKEILKKSREKSIGYVGEFTGDSCKDCEYLERRKCSIPIITRRITLNVHNEMICTHYKREKK